MSAPAASRALRELGPAAPAGRGVYRAEGAWWLPSHMLAPKLPSDADPPAAAQQLTAATELTASTGSQLPTTSTAPPSPRDTALHDTLSRASTAPSASTPPSASTARGGEGGEPSHRRLAAKCRTNLRLHYPGKWCSDLPVRG